MTDLRRIVADLCDLHAMEDIVNRVQAETSANLGILPSILGNVSEGKL